jgi:hypothetical protein
VPTYGWIVVATLCRALLIVTIAAGFASTIFVPLEAWLVSWLGWRAALMAAGIAVLATKGAAERI